LPARPAGPAGGRPETIEETAELVTAAGGRGIAVRVDHTKPADVRKLVAGIKRQHKGLDILVNDVWGGDALTELTNDYRNLEQPGPEHRGFPYAYRGCIQVFQLTAENVPNSLPTQPRKRPV
jgi:NAD(P)-dependent dehydrogenase (short-subunit alcohol dehydrogenase family)